MIHDVEQGVIIIHRRPPAALNPTRLCSACAGRNLRSFAISQLSGIVSLFFIAAAFLTSCSGTAETEMSMLPTFQLSDD